MNWQHSPQDLRNAYIVAHEAYMLRKLQLAWDAHAFRLEAERESVTITDAAFLRSLKIAPMEEE
jgi:hypothetical protein